MDTDNKKKTLDEISDEELNQNNNNKNTQNNNDSDLINEVGVKNTDDLFSKQNNDDKKQILILEKKIEELESSEERLKAACADFANQLQSNREQTMNAVKFSNKRLLERFLFFLDIFEKAIEMGQNSSLDKNIIGKFLEGFKMTKTEFEKILSEQKVEKIKITKFEDKFDPERHEIASFIEDEKYENNTILDVLRNGFFLYETVLRPSLVVINKKKEKKE